MKTPGAAHPTPFTALRGETVVITGGALRLGRAIALECARAGANVAITFHRSSLEARQTVQELHALSADNAQTLHQAYQLDVADSAQVAQLARDVETDFGGATMLVNNAAIFRRTPFETLSEADFDAHIAANLKGPFLLCRAFGEAFVRRGGGAIVNLADIYGSKPLKNYAPYCISKAGVLMLTQTLALALAPNVRVNALCPGTILPPSELQWPLLQGEDDASEEQMLRRIPLGRLGRVEDVAQAVLFLLSAPYVSGAILPVDGAQRLK